MTTTPHQPNPRIAEREAHGPQLIKNELDGFNGWLASKITESVGTMWCAYAFTALALVSLPEAIKGGTATLIAWIAQTLLQLVLLSVIMVGQKIAAVASDKQSLQTYRDAEALLKIQDELHRLIKINNDLTAQIHDSVVKANATAAKAASTPPRAPRGPSKTAG